MTPSGGSPQHVFNNSPGGVAHSRVLNLLASYQAAVDCLRESLADEVPLYRTGLDQVKNSPKNASQPEALGGLDISVGKVGTMQYENAGNLAIATEVRRDRHVKLRRIEVRQIIKAQRRVVTVNTLDILISVSGPEGPEDEIRSIGYRKQGEPVDTPVLANPIPSLYMIRVGVFGEASGLRLLGGKKALLLFGALEMPSCRFTV
jgi:hypothetical protein